jgi:hypothetical protein
MAKPNDPLANLRIAAPCPAGWDAMAGDDRVRHCSLCSLNVYNFGEMTSDEVRDVLAKTEGRVCARLYQRADGSVITRDCPTGLRALRRRASRIAAALFTTLLALPSLAYGGIVSKQPRRKTQKTNVQLQIETATAPQPAMFHGVVRDESGAPIPGVTVRVRDEASKNEIVTVTDCKGDFHITALNDGLYRVEATLIGFEPATIEHLQMKASKVTNAEVTLQVDRACVSVTVGVLVFEPMMERHDGMTTTFSQDFINKLPLSH